MIRSFQFLAAALFLAAAYFLYRRDLDTAFVTAVLGACAFFLSLRFAYKSRIIPREPLDEDDDQPDTAGDDAEPGERQ
jgi:hypothetical protein